MYIILILLQIFFVVLMAWPCALENMGSMWASFGSMPFLGLYAISLFAGIILCVIYAIKKQGMKCMILIVSCIVVSLLAFFPFTGLRDTSLVHILEPFAKYYLDKKQEVAQIKYVNKKKSDYDVLKEYFKQPRKVIKANGSLIMLDDYKVIAIDAAETPSKNYNFDQFVENNVIGHYVNVDIGSEQYFSAHYIPGGIGNFVMDLRKGMSLQEQTKLPFYAIIPAEVYLNGISLSDKLKEGNKIDASSIDGFRNFLMNTQWSAKTVYGINQFNGAITFHSDGKYTTIKWGPSIDADKIHGNWQAVAIGRVKLIDDTSGEETYLDFDASKGDYSGYLAGKFNIQGTLWSNTK